MSFEGYIEKMKKIQNSLLKYLEEESDVEENYENLKKILSDQKMTEDKHELKSILRLINTISNNHRRSPQFISRIERIIQEIKNEIKNRFSNSEIFELFEDNKRILLFLIKEEIVKIDENIFSKITKGKYVMRKYPQYFSPEIKPFLTEKFIEKCHSKEYDDNEETYDWIEEVKKEIPDDFDKKRLEGENDNHICELIRKHQAKDFIVYMNKEGLSFNGFIEESIFETNQFFLDCHNTSIIEYASFFGCIDIINYLIKIQEIKPTSTMWDCSIHSKNSELIHYLEDNEILPSDNKHIITLEESIKCHHNDISRYIIDYLIKEDDLNFDRKNTFFQNIYRYGIEYDNYNFFPDNIKYKFLFHYLCEFDYYKLVNILLINEDIDINKAIISTTNFYEI